MSKNCNVYCSVPQCKSLKRNDPKLGFYHFPEAGKYRVPLPNKYGEIEMVDARKAWIIKLKIGKPVTKSMRVCSLHFVEDDYIPRNPTDKIKRRVLKKIAVPSSNLPTSSLDKNVCQPSTSAGISDRSQRLAFRNLAKANIHICDSEKPSENEQLENVDDLKELILNCEDLEAANTLLSLTKERLKFNDSSVQVNIPKIKTLSELLKSDRDLSSFTEISNFKILDVLVKTVNSVYKDKRSHKLSLRERIILVFVKLKLNLSYTSLSVLFGVTESLVKNNICETIPILAKILKTAIYFPDTEEIKKNIPESFKDFKGVKIIIDCTEIYVQKPKCLCCRVRFYSHYKSAQTIKFMTGVSPGGLITFVSDAFGGRASDRTIFLKSNLITKLKGGEDKIMVDKGFLIDDICTSYNIGLIRPPFLKNKKQLSTEESLLNTKIAAARVHVERSNQRLKVFKVLSEKLQWNLVPYIDDIFIIICGLTNLSSPILSTSRFLQD